MRVQSLSKSIDRLRKFLVRKMEHQSSRLSDYCKYPSKLLGGIGCYVSNPRLLGRNEKLMSNS